ncbi:MAG TPA: DUF6600 domain-containing protein [Terriglobales bacterium]|nr:DUF6600 domain-containing protein [Terriglobales bacterium]
MNSLRRTVLAMVFVMSLSAALARAQDRSGPEGQDPPGRVARLQYMSGSVSMQPKGTGDWVEGSLNSTLTSADNVWADKDSRAELNFGTGILRISSETSLTLTNVGDGTVQVLLNQGTLNLRVRKLYQGEIYEVDTPNLAFTVQKSGDYRFDVDPDGDATVVTVRKGEGDATGQGSSVRLKSDEQARFTDGTSLTHTTAEAPKPDGFDDWCKVRNERLDNSLSARYVSPDVIGSEDLDQYGTWSEVPPYGPVWVPSSVPAGWAPYRYGHWAWIDPWGWTWVDDAPWGYAPFHYGRWVYYNNYWGWAPGPYYGPYYVRPVWAPALVTWFGGPGWGISFGFGFGGGFGWCALSWGEPFIPWYHAGWGYWRNVNVYNTHITNVNIIHNIYNGHASPPNRFANFNHPGGMTAVSRNTLANGLPVARNTIAVNARGLGNVSPLRGGPSVSPTREARLGPNLGRAAAMPPAHTIGRTAISGRPVAGERDIPTAQQTNGRPQNGMNTARNVPRPLPDTTGTRTAPVQTAHNVPRPPVGNSMGRDGISGRPSSGSTVQPGRSNDVSSPARSVPRPPASMNRPGTNQAVPSATRPYAGSNDSRSASVPRPAGRVLPASRVSSMGSYGNGSLRSSGSYGGSYGSPSNAGANGRYSQPPAYRGGGPSYRAAAPSYRGSAPSYHASVPSSHGGGSAPSYHGGGGGHSSGGGHAGRG